MKFMMLMIPGGYADAPVDHEPPAELVEKMGAYNQRLFDAGVLRSGSGLYPPAAATRVNFAGGKATAVDGPFPEVKEFLGGYWIIEVSSQQAAIDWALQCPALDGDTIEVRRMEELPEDEP